MADKFPNLPGIIVDVRDGNLSPDITVNGPTVVVLGTATKGPAKVESRTVSAATALSRFGVDGTLGRGLTEVFQGGTNNATGYRVLTTTSKIEHLGDVSGAAGYTIESVAEGSDALTKYSVFYSNIDDILKVYSAVDGTLVYSNDPDAPVDLGVVIVSGEKETGNTSGAIGKTVKVRTDETAQTATRTNGVSMAMPLGNNLALLQWDAARNPFVAQVRSALADKPAAKTAVVAATTGPLSACVSAGLTLTVSAAEVLVVDGVTPALNARILVKDQVDASDNGIYSLTTVGTVGPDVAWVLTRVADMDADAEVVALLNVEVSGGVANGGKSFVLTTAAPYTLGTTSLTFAEYDTNSAHYLIEDVISDLGLPGRTFTFATANKIDVTAFPAGLLHNVRFLSNKLPQRADKILADRLFVGASSPLIVTPGSNFNGLPKLVNSYGWAANVVDSAGVLAVAEVEPSKMNMYEAMEDAFNALEASDVDIIVVPGVYLDDPALDGEDSGASALPAALLEAAATTVASASTYCDLTVADADTAIVLLLANGRGGSWAVFTEPQGTAFGENLEAGELTRTARILNWEKVDGTTVRVHFDRDVSFSVDDTYGLVVAAQEPTVEIYATDLLFYHRSVEVAGKLRHLWYHETADADGYTYSEVNFAHRLGRFCADMTANENTAIGVIGVRPPANHFNPAALATWIGKSPKFDDEGLIITNGTGLLGNKFISGKLMADNSQFEPGFKATESGELDDDNILVDGNGFDVDLGKFLSIIASWPILTNLADSTGLGYINSAASVYAGLLGNLPVWQGATAKLIGGRGVKVPVKLAKRHQNSLAGQRYVILDQRTEGVIVVDAPSAALPTSDFTRNMTVRLVGEAIRVCREASRPFLGDPLSAIRRAALETTIKKTMSDLQRQTNGALETFESTLSQTALDKIRGTARLTLTMKVINELRKITVNVALSL